MIGKDEVSEAKRDVRPPGGFRKKLFKFSSKKFVSLNKSPYLCSRNRNDSDKFFENITYQQVVQETYRNTKHTVSDYDKDEILSEDINNFNNEEFDPGSG